MKSLEQKIIERTNMTEHDKKLSLKRGFGYFTSFKQFFETWKNAYCGEDRSEAMQAFKKLDTVKYGGKTYHIDYYL